MPFLFLLIVDAFRAMDLSLERRRVCGASRLRTFCTVTLQLMLPALTGAAILSFIRGVENFRSPLFFSDAGRHPGHHHRYLRPINQRSPPIRYQYATATSFKVLMALLFLIVLLQWRLLRRAARCIPSAAKGYSPRGHQAGKWRWVTFGFCLLFFVVTGWCLRSVSR